MPLKKTWNKVGNKNNACKKKLTYSEIREFSTVPTAGTTANDESFATVVRNY